MKIKFLVTLVSGFLFLNFSVKAQQDSTGMPGDHFSLQGALEMFKQSSSPEDFEKRINTQSNNVNNLDLNGDGETDYIKVIDKMEGNVHAFVLQVVVSETEDQDIAVIELEKTGDTTAILQIIGDEDIYGEQIIVEASEEGDEVSDDNGGNVPGNGPSWQDEPYRIIINVFFWPSVRFVYRPAYTPWASPWRWRRYPAYWRPWRPVAWHVFHPRCHPFRRHFAVVRTHRVIAAHRVYTPFRRTSVTVRTRTTVVRTNYRTTRVRKVNINVNKGNNGNGKDEKGRGRGKGKGRRG